MKSLFILNNKRRRALFLSIFLVAGFMAQYTDLFQFVGIDNLPTQVKKADAWYDTSYIYKKQLTIDGTQVPGGSTLTNFPVLVSITDTQLRTTSYGGRVNNANGYDIIFTDGSEGTKLSHEIESYDQTTGTLKAWVKIPSLFSGSDTSFYVYYGNSGIGSSQENKTDVWSNGYVGVWHLGTNLLDSTLNANNGTNVGATTGVAGMVGTAVSFNGSTQRVTVPNTASLKPSNLTVSMWMKSAGAQQTYACVTWFGQNSAAPNGPYGVQFYNTSDTAILSQVASDTVNSRVYPTDTISSGTWFFEAFSYDGSTHASYVNLNRYTATPNLILGNYDTTNGLGIGNRYDGDSLHGFNGAVDEERIANVARTAGWLNTEYYTVQNQGSGVGKFIKTVGGEIPYYQPPTLTTYNPAALTDTTAIFNGSVVTQGLSGTIWFRYGTSNPSGNCASLPNTTSPVSIPTPSTSNTGYQLAMTGLSVNTTYWYCVSANTSAGPGNGNVVQFNTSTSLSTGCSLFPGSVLAVSGDDTKMNNWLGSSKFAGTLLYRKSVNGNTYANFHTAVDNQGPTIVLIKNQASGQVYGGYNPNNWTSSGTYTAGAGGFLFNLTNNFRLLPYGYTDYQTYNASSYGPTFGGGHDLGFTSATNMDTQNYQNPYTYQNPSAYGYSYLSGGAINITTSNVEVYKLSTCTISAPTVTTPTSASITATSATLGGNVTSAGTAAITARGICYAPTATDADPRIGDPGVTCTPEGGTTTGVFTIPVSNLQGNTAYSYNAYATNSVGTTYSLGTFSTLNPSPTSVTTAANDAPQSYYVNLKGSGNPNGYPTYAHFRVFDYNPGNCTSDANGAPAGKVNIRFPEGSDNFPDINIGSGNGVVNFNYQIPLNASNFLTPNTTYYYCAYAVNTVSATNYTTGATSGGTGGVVTFTTPDGPANPCDPPSSGNLTIPAGAVCNFTGTVGGVDAGTGTKNTAQLIIPSGTRLSIAAGQKVAFGSVNLARGSIIAIARGGSLAAGGVYVHDNDRDNYLDDATQYVGSTPSAATEFIRRNAISSIFNYSWKIASSGAMYDCNKNTPYAYMVLPNLVRDADNDGYKTSAPAGPQCVGAAGVFNGRTYYNDGSGPN